jgi:putative two-component system response regulator
VVCERTDQLEFARKEVFNCLARAAEFRDDDTGNHVLRVGKYAGIIARGLGWTPDKVEELELAAQLHDIGKIGVPDAILHKPGKLDEQEYNQMKKHPGYGHRILEDITTNHEEAQVHAKIGSKILEPAKSPILMLARTIAITHHERWDGEGYPFGLSKTDIPLAGRITAIADVFDALSSKRPYKPAFPYEKCVQIISEGRGGQFDPQLVDIFLAAHHEIIDTMQKLQPADFSI